MANHFLDKISMQSSHGTIGIVYDPTRPRHGIYSISLDAGGRIDSFDCFGQPLLGAKTPDSKIMTAGAALVDIIEKTEKSPARLNDTQLQLANTALEIMYTGARTKGLTKNITKTIQI